MPLLRVNCLTNPNPLVRAARTCTSDDGDEYKLLAFDFGPDQFLVRRRWDGIARLEFEFARLLASVDPAARRVVGGRPLRAGELDGPPLRVDPALAYPRFVAGRFSVAPDGVMVFLKRPHMLDFEDVARRDRKAACFLAELRLFEVVREHPHPNIVLSHRVVVREDRIVGVALAPLHRDLLRMLRLSEDVDRIVAEVAGALRHLHALSPPYCHNDLSPANIMWKAADDPTAVLIDFDACAPVGTLLRKGNLYGWGNGATTSHPNNDWEALEKVAHCLRTGEQPDGA